MARLAGIEASFRRQAEEIARAQLEQWRPKGICDATEEEFVDRIASEIVKVIRREDVIANPPGGGPVINLFGFGTVPEVLTEVDLETGVVKPAGYFWGHDAAAALGWDGAKFTEWAESQRKFDLIAQRSEDEESGALGWDCIRHHPMGLHVWQGGRSSEDHYVDGQMRGPIMRYWGDLYLIHSDRVMSLMSASPWSAEFMSNLIPLMAWGMKRSGLEENARDVPTYVDGAPTGGTLADMFARDREGITEEEAARRAMRGPVLDTDTTD